MTFENRCERTLNGGRHVCLLVRGHDGECQPNVNAPWPPAPVVPDIEDGGCDVCDDPKCYRNQLPESDR